MHVRNDHRYAEEMLSPPFDGKLISNLGNNFVGVRLLCIGSRYKDHEKEKSKERYATRKSRMEGGHLELASAVVGCGAANFFRSFSQSPSKLPLDMISRRSLGLAWAARNSAMASPPET